MNVFQFGPHFLLGIVLGVLAVHSRSVLPAVLFPLRLQLHDHRAGGAPLGRPRRAGAWPAGAGGGGRSAGRGGLGIVWLLAARSTNRRGPS